MGMKMKKKLYTRWVFRDRNDDKNYCRM